MGWYIQHPARPKVVFMLTRITPMAPSAKRPCRNRLVVDIMS